MITAKVNYSSPTGTHECEVEVLDSHLSPNGSKSVLVRALPVNGRRIYPFTRFSMGGPVQDDSMWVSDRQVMLGAV